MNARPIFTMYPNQKTTFFMSQNAPTRSVALIGFGPRGLSALEALATQAIKNKQIFEVTIIDPFK